MTLLTYAMVSTLFKSNLLLFQFARNLSRNEWALAKPAGLSLAPFDTVTPATGAMFTETKNYWGYETTPVEAHLFVITIFCATIAPFGGYFAFGLKKALRAQSLGETMTKGGVIDKIDCLIVTGFFLIIYITAIVYQTETTVGRVKSMIGNLSP